MTTNDDGVTPTGGHTPLTPPPADAPTGAPAAASAPSAPAPSAPAPAAPVPPAAGGPGASAPEPASNGWRGVGITTAVIGGIALIGAGLSGGLAAASELSHVDSASSVDVTGVESLRADVGASDVSIVFGDVEQAELTITDARNDRWTLERDGDELVLGSPDRWFGWNPARWFQFDDWFSSRDERVELVLPESLAGIDADITLSAGSLRVDGAFGELDLELGAGALTVEGTADSVDADVSAGRARIELADVRTADLTVSAGRLDARFTGTAPDETRLDVSAGGADVTLPDVAYAVTQDVSAGTLDNRLNTSSGASRTIEVFLSAGSATLRAED